MRWSVIVPCLLALTVLSACISIKFGREFPSPDPKMIVAGKTDKTSLQRMFGEPYQVGLDSGDQTWRWFYGQRESGASTNFGHRLQIAKTPLRIMRTKIGIDDSVTGILMPFGPT